MSDKKYLLFDDALSLARPIVETLRPYCGRIEIAGSLRRGRAQIGDIEIVAIPCAMHRDMFGGEVESHSLDDFDFSMLGDVKKNGHKYKKIVLPGGFSVDLFIVTPPSQWGVQLLLRTGSAGFSKRFVTTKSFGGYLPGHLKVKDGAIWHKTTLIPTPEDKDVFKVIGLRWIPPEAR